MTAKSETAHIRPEGCICDPFDLAAMGHMSTCPHGKHGKPQVAIVGTELIGHGFQRRKVPILELKERPIVSPIEIVEPPECPVCHDRTIAPNVPCSDRCLDAYKEELMYRLWETDFMRDGMCGLCGNSGIVDTIGIARTATGKPNGVRAHCICPNGRRMKQLGIEIPAR